MKINNLILLFLIGAGSCGVLADSIRETNIYNTYETMSYAQSDTCKNAALASAIGNNQMSTSFHKPQVSLGFGGCEGTYAASVMVGGKACAKCALINGSLSVVGDTKVMGIGIMWPL